MNMSSSQTSPLYSLGLVIQGPLVSRGVSGSGEISTFDCVQNIEEIAKQFGNLFSEIVVSTWEDEDKEQISQVRDLGIKVATFQDPRKHGFTGFWSDNRDRQYVSSINGINSLSDQISFVCKIRTDQYFDLHLFIEEFFQIHTAYKDYETLGLPSFIHGLMIEATRPYSMCDYAYMAEIGVLRSFYQAQFDFQDSPHTEDLDFPEGDSIRKYLFANQNRFAGFSPSQFVPALPKDLSYLKMPIGNVPVPVETLLLWQAALITSFSVSSSKVMNSLIWRGTPVKSNFFHQELLFLEEWKLARVSYIALLSKMDKDLVQFRMTSKWFRFEHESRSKVEFQTLRIKRYIYRLFSKILNAGLGVFVPKK